MPGDVNEEPVVVDRFYNVLGVINVILNLINSVYIIPLAVAVLQIVCLVIVHKASLNYLPSLRWSKKDILAFILQILVFLGAVASFGFVLFFEEKENPISIEGIKDLTWARISLFVSGCAIAFSPDDIERTAKYLKIKRERREKRRNLGMDVEVEAKKEEKKEVDKLIEVKEDSRGSKESSNDPEKEEPIDYKDPSRHFGDAPAYF